MNIKEFIVGFIKIIFVCVLLCISCLNYVRIKGPDCRLCSGLRGVSISVNSFNVRSGSFLILKEGQYRLNDVITFQEPSGDRAVGLIDSLSIDGFVVDMAPGASVVRKDLIDGKVILVIPYLGYLMTVIDSQLGVFLLIIMPICVVLIIEIEAIVNYVNKRWGVGSYDIKRPS